MRAAYFVTVKPGRLVEWDGLRALVKHLRRRLNEHHLLFLGAPDFSTVGLHLHIVIFNDTGSDRPLASDGDVLEIVGMALVDRGLVEDSHVRVEAARDLESLVNYAIGCKSLGKMWIVPRSLKRKRLLLYPRRLFSKSLREIERERREWCRENRSYFAKRLPLPSLMRMYDQLRLAFERSKPLIERMEGPLWKTLSSPPGS